VDNKERNAVYFQITMLPRSSRLKMTIEAAESSETPIPNHHTTQHNNPENHKFK
jgi:hypothetical protein